MDHMKFTRRYLILNEVLNAVTHGIGFGLSIAGLVILLIKGARLDSPIHIISYAIYGSMMILLFLFSTLFHSLMFTRAKKVFQVFDHASIFLLVAGSYTPFCLLSIQGWLGWTLFILIWLLAISGIVYKSLTLHKKETLSKISTLIYINMGWLCVIAFKPLIASLGFWGTFLLASGGVSYTVGALFYSIKSVRFMHVVWHLFVMLGAGLMYFSVLWFT
ncbi:MULTISPECIES: PAQR family membrane homeostasis protein TrhA [Enterococcus]|uniref:PAQR family membrane homeostasis protein TrhA n=1 Tax=Enterococcus TaxID=1350 RepID=UPI000F4DED10|nr:MULTISPECIES: hemolysin III family protein [Enterococcus]AYY10358.1 hemolysin III family protein [Enterococcus sp. FDAARGOS_553]MCD4986265.1 hemolysin III family protein [Enterococcus gallinarum]MDT2720034.1 hemolysin III family protein [Enterococcus gallinarum]MDV7785992.1 hemolysin III family protein [Enterococcus gallinarum]UQR01847.1 hemolysin III family protein [Enterococcus gallinarum]